MLTPRFELSQTDSLLTVIIYAPYTNIAETEVFVEENQFIFYSAPYYLRFAYYSNVLTNTTYMSITDSAFKYKLHLPGLVEESRDSHGSYSADEGKFVINVSKVTPGQNFPDLDLLTSLLSPPGKRVDISPGIQVIGDGPNAGPSVEEESEEEFEWFLEQKIPEPEPNSLTIDGPKYGFANQKAGVFRNLQYESSELLDLPSPDTTPASYRSSLRIQREQEDFNEDHYLADLMDNPDIPALLAYKSPWNGQKVDDINFTVAEQDIMKELPNREFLFDKEVNKMLYLGVVDLLAGYCYNHRSTLGENTSESAWTINKLSATLCWLECFSDLRDVVLAARRRSLCYPLHRHWDLSVKVLEDVVQVLHLGKKQVLKCLLEVHSLFNSSEPRYLLNQLYIRDYCVWIQQASNYKLASIADALSKTTVDKDDVGLELLELEHAAQLVLGEETSKHSVAELSSTLTGLCLSNNLADSSGSISHNQISTVCQEDDSSSSSDSDSDSTSDSSDSSSLDSDDFSFDEIVES
ncbi:unnamed protein product [Timema podura]|uniref:Protein SHQ1 homolog n=1 Tax=Timema podura TaxID=61482 RepID=A0ABN7NN54_TIMPD|nr:unnamed protein product [Timema podura]